MTTLPIINTIPTLNRFTTEADKSTAIIARRHSIKYHSDFSRLSGMVYLHHSLEVLTLANCFHMFLWSVDDYFDDSNVDRKKKLKLLEELRNTLSSGTGYELLSELMQTMSKHSVYKHWRTKVMAYLNGVEKHLDSDLTKLTYEQYEAIRFDDSACETVWPMILLERPYTDYLNSKEGIRACYLANHHVCLINDINSLKKDKGYSFNGVLIWAKENGKTKEESIRYSVEQANRDLSELTTILRDCPAENKYIVQGLIDWCTGSQLWHETSPRYNPPQNAKE